MSLLQANLRTLYARHPGLRSLGLESGPQPAGADCLAVEASASGLATARLGGTYLHSRYDPRAEARRQLERELPARFGAAVFLGFGLGYLPESFVARHPGRPLAVAPPARPRSPPPSRVRSSCCTRGIQAAIGWAFASGCPTANAAAPG